MTSLKHCIAGCAVEMAKALRLCFICNEYPPSSHGGIGTVTRDLAEGLAAAGMCATVIGVYSPQVLAVSETIVEWINGVKVIRLPAVSKFIPAQAAYVLNRLRLLMAVKKEYASQPFDLLEVPDYEGILPWGGIRNVPIVCRGHGSAAYFDAELHKRRASRIIYHFEKQTLARADHLVFVSKYTARKELEISGLDREFEVIYNAVDTDYFSPDGRVVKDKGLILFVNTINPKKGVEPLMQAVNEVFEKDYSARLRLLGKCFDDAYLQKLIDLVQPKFQQRVEFLGHVDRAEVVRQMRQANLCVFPSFSEAFAMGPLEAMAVGCPVVYTKLASGPETIEDRVSGVLCDPHHPSDIAHGILSILGDEDFAQLLGRNARSRVIHHFNKADWIPQNLTYYRSILQKD